MIGLTKRQTKEKYKMKRKVIKDGFVIRIKNASSYFTIALFIVLSVVVQNNVNYVGCEEQIQSYFGEDPHRSGHYSNQYSSSSSSSNDRNGLTLDSAAFKQGIVKDCLQQCPDQVGLMLWNDMCKVELWEVREVNSLLTSLTMT